jgi:uroporphyrinogen decarboxylase
MNARERVRLALTGHLPDHIPMTLGFYAQSLPGIPDADEHFDLDVRYAEFSPPDGQDDFLRYLRRLPKDAHVGTEAQLRTYHEWDYHPEMSGGRLGQARTIAELAEAVFPDLTHPKRYAGLTDRVKRWHERGLAVAGSPPHLGGELFETAWRMRGFEEFLIDLIERKSLAAYLLDQLTAMLIHNALILARAGVDILLLDDDIAMPTGLIVGPELWREFFKPRMLSAIRLAREASPELLVFYHSDGDFSRLIPDLVEIGVNAINPIQPDCMDAMAIKRAFGDRLALWGTVGTASAWDFGAADQIRHEVRVRIDTLGPAGLLLAPAYDIDFTPRATVEAFVAAGREFGEMD